MLPRTTSRRPRGGEGDGDGARLMGGRSLALLLAALAVSVAGGIVGTRVLAQPEQGQAVSSSNLVDSPDRPADPVTQEIRQAVDRAALRVARLTDRPGFASLRLDYERGAVRVTWKGAPPDDLFALSLQDPDGVDVVIEDATYSAAELGRAANRLFRAYFDERLDGALLVGTLPRDDGSGIEAEIVEPWEGSEEDLARVAGVPVTVTVIRADQAPQPTED